MSRHSCTNLKHVVAIGVDSEYKHVFASVLEKGNETSPGPFELTNDGVDQAIAAVEQLINFKIPQRMRDALYDDLVALAAGRNIEYSEIYH